MSFLRLLGSLGAFVPTVPPVGAPDLHSNLSAVDDSTCPSCVFDYEADLSWTNGDSEQTRIYRNGSLQATVSAGVSTWTDTDALSEDVQYKIGRASCRERVYCEV